MASNWVTRQLGNTPSYGSCFLQSQCLSQFNSIRFLYKQKTTHSGPLCKMGLILLGERRVLQTNIMDDNQLCNPLCTDLFWHAGMSKYNKTAFLIKEEVINLMICSPCELFTASIPRYTTHPSIFLHIRLLCYCATILDFQIKSQCDWWVTKSAGYFLPYWGILDIAVTEVYIYFLLIRNMFLAV